MPFALPSVAWRPWADRLLLALLVAVAFLLGCYEMGDSDIWWHLRGGQWILENGRVPSLDPFTFASADRPWVDVHWSYEVILALAYAAGGTGALVLLAAAVGAAALLVCLSARRRAWPAAAVALCWLPALVLFGFRLDPRPEMFSLLYLACFLAVLWRAEQRPALVWLLVPLQVLWVNVQGLFVLGPVVLGLFLAARGAGLLWRRFFGTWTWGPAERRWWRHFGAAAAAVLAACLVNPYFLAGALFPFELFPKVAAAGNLFKEHIAELMSPRAYVELFTADVVTTNWFFLAFYFLLLLVPFSFLFPAAWRAWWAARRPGAAGWGAHAPAWLGGLAAGVGLLALGTVTLSGKGLPGWVVALGDNVPLLLLAGGAVAALVLRERGQVPALLAVVGGAALAVWVVWLQALLLGGGRGLLAGSDPVAVAVPLLLLGGAAAGLVLLAGGDLFRVLLAGAFASLGLMALQNWTRFALVAGTVLAWNFGEWAAQLAAAWPGRRPAAAGWGLRAALAGALGLWVAALATDGYYVHTGFPRHLGFREQPLQFAHEAVQFAGRPGLPDRALVYGLAQTGVYVFHNAPGRKPYMDGRLEMPDPRTFETYLRIDKLLGDRDPRWQAALAELGNPLVLLEHSYNHSSEAVLLTSPGWRCVYYDALASVFVPRGAADAGAFPTVDFAARHFQGAAAPPTPAVPGAAAREQKALFKLSAALTATPEATWRWRVPAVLLSLDRGRLALAEQPEQADAWALLGNSYWSLNPQPRVRPPGPADAWNLEQGIYWAQATCCLRRAVALRPEHPGAWNYLAQAYHARGMIDAQLAAWEQWLLHEPRATDEKRQEVAELRRLAAEQPLPEDSSGRLPDLVAALLRSGRPEAAAQLLDAAGPHERADWDWPFAEQAAGLYMHLGRPDDARRVWGQARGCPSAALRRCRVAGTFWAEGDLQAAVAGFQEARAADPRLGEACWALALLHAQKGDAARAVQACRQGLRLSLTARQRSDLEDWERFLLPYAAH
jgi:tetratricopeptide (TPR) repeat protein